VPVPTDNPALHQGRVRTTPHVEGQFAAHVYVALTLSRRSQLYSTIRDILSDAKEVVPALHPIWPADARRPELHVSLSRPIFLRAHQREEFKRTVKRIAQLQKPSVRLLTTRLHLIIPSHTSFQVSFTTLSELTNDEKTRTFLTIEIGAGFPDASLHSFRLSLVYLAACNADAQPMRGPFTCLEVYPSTRILC
jgi:RNase P protein component